MELRLYQHKDGKVPFDIWLAKVRDKRARAKILIRLNRIQLGNFGDFKSVGQGVSELRISEGKGCRVYYGCSGKEIILLLCGGDKATQQIDIQQAKKYWENTVNKAVKYNTGDYLNSPEEVATYIESVLEEDDPALLLVALRNVVDSQGGMAMMAEHSGLSRESLYRTLSTV